MQVVVPTDGGQETGSAQGSKKQPEAAPAPEASAAAASAAEDMAQRAEQWVERLAGNPGEFATIELEVHQRMRQHTDRFVAGLLAQAGARPEMAGYVQKTLNAAEVPLRPVEKKDGR